MEIHMQRSGHADLPLHTGTVPKWLADRMMVTGTLIIESLVMNYGRKEALVRLSDPLWFQSFGAVMGMDWHSSGITTSVMYALKRGLNPRARDLGICVCGGRGKYSRRTPDELRMLAEISSLDGDSLIKASRLSAKVDNTAVQDGFQLYQHNFIVTCDGDWAVVQQGMNVDKRAARRYHWCSDNLRLFAGSTSPSDCFLNEPHTGVTGENKGSILNLTAADADKTRNSILAIAKEEPSRILKECELIVEKGGLDSLKKVPPADGTNNSGRVAVMPAHHEVRKEDVNLKRLGAVLATAYEKQPEDFSSLLLTEGLGPRTLQSLTLVSEVIHGTPSRFSDPARFSFAHGGKDGHPFPVPLKIYDESIRVLQDSIEKSKLGYNEKSECIRKLHTTALRIEQQCEPEADFDAVIERERRHSKEWGGRTVGD
ncbi:MAG: DUF763 domain-containing protein [Spirochaetaceae bacterium]|nr:DUF763 domain-containing protein [Spirochaetaceae bacterium]